MKHAATIAAALLLTSCDPTMADLYPGCHQIGTGGVVCLVGDVDTDVIPALALGLNTWAGVFALEWGEDRLADVLSEVAVFYGNIAADDGCPCRDRAGCQDRVAWGGGSELWVAAGPLPGTALQHETTHAAEWTIENRTDYEHDDVPHRWTELARRALRAWREAVQ